MSDEGSGPLFDLTTVRGLAAVHDFIRSPAGVALFPAFYLWSEFAKWLNTPSDISPEKQGEVARRVIETARRNGARRVKLRIEKSVGLKLKGTFGPNDRVAASVGSDGAMELEVEF